MDEKQQGVEIRLGAYYDLDWLRRHGWGVAALRSARRKGLKIGRCGRKSWVAADDLIAHIRSTSTEVR